MPPDAVIRVGTKEPSMDVDRVGESEVDRDDEDISRVEMGNENEKEKALVEVVVVGRGEEGEVGVGSFVVKDGRVSTNKDRMLFVHCDQRVSRQRQTSRATRVGTENVQKIISELSKLNAGEPLWSTELRGKEKESGEMKEKNRLTAGFLPFFEQRMKVVHSGNVPTLRGSQSRQVTEQLLPVHRSWPNSSTHAPSLASAILSLYAIADSFANSLLRAVGLLRKAASSQSE
ncbi:hypothetical protein RhiXN_00683 [Rhizoctonia solani]|uniref:Uncharacterized protein n=1 Tax=Rhizoctonia solani TaxID=456999 RepID=A0A8H8NW94_9AGAM|nr:uncharacterized protein RhiXN_00683 [Rhizoctonia solani]QRW19277.1 hypothetical protein RhiXN_00683 [Rhizoctonia solani]